MVDLIVHEIGCAGDPAATRTTQHATPGLARAVLVARYGVAGVRGDDLGGTVGSMTGRVFQASKTWNIRDIAQGATA